MVTTWREQLNEHRRDYYEGLGRFVDQFARVEQHIHFKLIMIAGLSIDAGNEVFAGMQMDRLIDACKRLFSLRTPPAQVALHFEAAMSRLKKISGLRNTLLHSGTYFQMLETPIASNQSRTRDGVASRAFEVPPEAFKQLCSDLLKVEAHLDSAVSSVVPTVTVGSGPDFKATLLNRKWGYRFDGMPDRVVIPRRERKRGLPKKNS